MPELQTSLQHCQAAVQGESMPRQARAVVQAPSVHTPLQHS